MRTKLFCAAFTFVLAAATGLPAAAQVPDAVQFRVLATNRTSTMERELNEAAEAGYRFASVMGGETAIGGKEVVAVVEKSGSPEGRFAYKLLATSKTSTMEKELKEAAAAGYEYCGQTIFSSMMGGQEVVVILERDKEATARSDYRLLATLKTSTLEKELKAEGERGFHVVGLTVAKTAFGGSEIVTILRRQTN